MSLLDTASLIVTPNGYKEGKLYSVIPSDGSGDLSVTRATTATRVNSQGLVELVPYNLVQYSQDFSNSYWTKFGATLTSGQADPFGGNNAFLFNDNSTGSFAYAPTGFVYSQATVSIYAKYSSDTSSMIYVDNGTAKLLYFNPQNGTIISTPSGYTSSITDVGNGWYRVTLTGAIDGAVGFGTFGGGAVSTYFFGYQLVEGSVAKDYQKTETRLNIPRLDYSNGTCPSLLVEPQRTNLFLYSSSFDSAAWNYVSAVKTPNATTSPSGNTDAQQLEFNSGYIFTSAVTSASATSSISCYAKKGTANTFVIQEANYVGTSVTFDLNNGTVTSGTGTIEDVGNGWYRCTTQFAYGSGQTTATWAFRNYQSGYIYLWGAQLEVGSYATSYIPTTSASVTRNADVISKTGISSLIGQTEGTLFVEAIVLAHQDNNTILSVNDGTLNEYMVISGNGSGQVNAFILDSGNVSSIISGTYAVGTTLKCALAYKTNDVAYYINGVQIGTDTSVTIPTASQVNIGSLNFLTAQLQGNIKAAALWKTRLTNTQLASLTTL